MTAPSTPKGLWGPDQNELSLKADFPIHAHCCNTRYMFAGCPHILLLRCRVHPVNELSLENACPDPKETFAAVEVGSSCPVCAEQAETRDQMLKLDNHIGLVDAELHACRASKGRGDVHCAMRGNVLEAELQRAKEAYKALDCSFVSCGGGPGLDWLGLRESYAPGKF